MPNHTSNILTVECNKKLFEEIREFLKGKDSAFDMNKIIEKPEELSRVSSPVTITTEEGVKKAMEENKRAIEENSNLAEYLNTLPITQETSDEYMKKYGVNNWYDWCIKYWGTKWNAYSVSDWTKQSICFLTAWSPPIEAIRELSDKFPKAKFILSYVGEGNEYVGITGIENDTEYELCYNDIEGMKNCKKRYAKYF
jgi:hypothetical protein